MSQLLPLKEPQREPFERRTNFDPLRLQFEQDEELRQKILEYDWCDKMLYDTASRLSRLQLETLGFPLLNPNK